MKRRVSIILVLLAAALTSGVVWDRLSIRESGHGFVIENRIVLAEYGYSRDGDVLRWAIIRTWPRDSTEEQRRLDPRVSRGYFFWPLVRDTQGRMTPVGACGNIYFFDGEQLNTMRVAMNEHTDTIPLDDARTLDQMWAYLKTFRVAD